MGLGPVFYFGMFIMRHSYDKNFRMSEAVESIGFKYILTAKSG